MASRLKKHAHILRFLASGKPAVCKAVVKAADPQLINCLCECAHNILKGNIPLTKAQKQKLTWVKQGLRSLAKKSTSQKQKKKILQKGGFLGALLAPVAATVLSQAVKGIVSGITRRRR